MKIEFTLQPKAEDTEFLSQKIIQETPGFEEVSPFAFFIRDEEGGIIAGCNGYLLFGAIYTDQLWVHPGYRKGGLGRQLMTRVHDYGLEKGCAMATVGTMTFQGAQAFYEKLGYGVDFEQAGYARNSSMLSLKRGL